MINLADLPGGRRAIRRHASPGAIFLSYFPFADPAGVALFDALERDVFAGFGGR